MLVSSSRGYYIPNIQNQRNDEVKEPDKETNQGLEDCVDLDSARQSQIEAPDLERGSPEPQRQADEEEPFAHVTTSQNSPWLLKLSPQIVEVEAPLTLRGTSTFEEGLTVEKLRAFEEMWALEDMRALKEMSAMKEVSAMKAFQERMKKEKTQKLLGSRKRDFVGQFMTEVERALRVSNTDEVFMMFVACERKDGQPFNAGEWVDMIDNFLESYRKFFDLTDVTVFEYLNEFLDKMPLEGRNHLIEEKIRLIKGKVDGIKSKMLKLSRDGYRSQELWKGLDTPELKTFLTELAENMKKHYVKYCNPELWMGRDVPGWKTFLTKLAQNMAEHYLLRALERNQWAEIKAIYSQLSDDMQHHFCQELEKDFWDRSPNEDYFELSLLKALSGKRLNLTDCPYLAYVFGPILKNADVEILNLENCKLPSIEKLTLPVNVEVLILRNALPESLSEETMRRVFFPSKLKKLKTLDIRGNALTKEAVDYIKSILPQVRVRSDFDLL